MSTHNSKVSGNKSPVARAVAQQGSKQAGLQVINNRPQAALQRKMQENGSCFAAKVAQRHAAASVVQRRMLPVARHREIVVDAAKRLVNPVEAKESSWIKAIYEELEGEGHPGADRCVDKLIEQRILDQEDWAVIENDYKLYKAQGGKGFDLFERHNVPAAFNKDTADKWVASLIKNRIHDLYSTLPGFNGHAMQVYHNIRSLNGWYQEGKFSEAAYNGYKNQIISELQKGKSKSQLPIPEFVYEFAGQSMIKI